MKNFKNKVAAITGAASGMGRTLALELARRGCHLSLSDVNEIGLAETAQMAGKLGVKVTTTKLNVADREAMNAWAEQTVRDHGKVNLIFNNAGVALIADIEPMAIKDMEWLMGINLWGVVHGTQAFLPHLTASGEGHVVNLSSVFGLMAFPGQSAYNAAKFGVRGFTDCLRMELEIEGCGVSATTVHPGGIRTNIARNARMDSSAAALAGGDAGPAVVPGKPDESLLYMMSSRALDPAMPPIPSVAPCRLARRRRCNRMASNRFHRRSPDRS